jgi:nucleoside-diphosphate-sugar epimerase
MVFSDLLETGKISLHVGDIAQRPSVQSWFEAVHQRWGTISGVFHVASFGMSGNEMLQPAKIEAVNVGGTKHVAALCEAVQCGAMVYTSTTNVVFDGRPIPGGDESLPYAPLDTHSDPYSRTKTMAEQYLQQHCPTLNVKVIAIRAAGIYGEGEERHLPRFVQTMQRGLFQFTIGPESNVCEFVHVDNLVHAHCLAMDRLLHSNRLDTSSMDAFTAYFCSDAQPLNNFHFFRPLTLTLGYKYPHPWACIPVPLMWWIAFIIELLVHLRILRSPLMTRGEVYKVGVCHWFTQKKIRNELGYVPLITAGEGMDRVLWYWMHRVPSPHAHSI